MALAAWVALMTIGDGLVGVALTALLGSCVWWLLMTFHDRMRRPTNRDVERLIRSRTVQSGKTKVKPRRKAIDHYIDGIDQRWSIGCDGDNVHVDGIDNSVHITGHCHELSVSGVRNVITGDAAVDNIRQSGIENQVRLKK